jgi:hypothetical protein
MDLKLDININIQYQFAKVFYYTISRPHDLVESESSITYDPDMIGVDLKNLTFIQKNDIKTKYPEKY